MRTLSPPHQHGGLIGASEILPLQRLLGDAINILRKVPPPNHRRHQEALPLEGSGALLPLVRLKVFRKQFWNRIRIL